MSDSQRYNKYVKPYLTEAVVVLLEAQRLRVLDAWEPGIVHALGQLADLSHQRVLELTRPLGDGPFSPARAQETALRAGRELAALAAERVALTKDLLRDLAAVEFRRAAEILTVNGLAAPLPRLEDLEGLAGWPAVDHGVGRGLGRYLRAVSEALAAPALEERLAAARERWRAGLATTARTTVHAVVGRAKAAAGASLR